MPLLLPTEHLPSSFASVGQDSARLPSSQGEPGAQDTESGGASPGRLRSSVRQSASAKEVAGSSPAEAEQDTASDWMDAMAAWGSIEVNRFCLDPMREDVR